MREVEGGGGVLGLIVEEAIFANKKRPFKVGRQGEVVQSNAQNLLKTVSLEKGEMDLQLRIGVLIR